MAPAEGFWSTEQKSKLKIQNKDKKEHIDKEHKEKKTIIEGDTQEIERDLEIKQNIANRK